MLTTPTLLASCCPLMHHPSIHRISSYPRPHVLCPLRPLCVQAQLDRFAAMADALAKGDGPAQGLAEDFFISATWLQ